MSGSPVQILVLLTVLTVLPALIVSATPFLRITLVLHFLRQALGTQDCTLKPSPPGPFALPDDSVDAAGSD